MKNRNFFSLGLSLGLLGLLGISCAPKNPASDVNPAPGEAAVTVTAANFSRAETDLYFSTAVKQAGGVGRFHHYRELMPIDNQSVIRANRDVLYSAGVFDLEAGPVTVSLPEPGKRFMSMMLIDEDQYAETVYAPGTFTYTKEKVGTRYIMLGIRTFIDPNDEDDVRQVHTLQDSITVKQESEGSFEIPDWDKASQQKIRDSLITISKDLPDTKGMFGARGHTDSVRHLIGSATAWGGNPEQDAMYLPVTPAQNDGKSVYKLTVKDVPVDGFWSISVYNKEGYFEKNELDSYSINNVTAKTISDGSVAIQFGGCDGKIANCIPTVPGWNYWVRLYRPQEEVLDGSWKFPEAKPVE